MLSRLKFRIFLLVASAMLFAGLSLSAQDTKHRGRKYKAPPPTTRIEVTILRDADSKPITNASVIFHLVGDTDNMELKTNAEGKTMIDVLPTGSKVRLQVIAKGYQTYGKDFDLDKPEIAFGIRMKRPGEQYSIYKDHTQDADAGDASGTDKAVPAKDAPSKDSAKDKPADSAQSDSQPNTTRPEPQ